MLNPFAKSDLEKALASVSKDKSKSVALKAGRTLGKVLISKMDLSLLKSKAVHAAEKKAIKDTQDLRNEVASNSMTLELSNKLRIKQIEALAYDKTIAKMEKKLNVATTVEPTIIEPTIDTISDELKQQIIAEAIAAAEAE